ncbi:hypothetical protein JX265_009964 [Neoarthrinium moseri]|uniref:Rhodopsin domain-containing protein n=1 Tax=Neoarthrinium moseri TaxID=1658444 RepID=A0A9Q0AIY6_9PEZI|nr:hypothetical protein JX265_009964 [Neoarthrinium moseri]
MPLGGKGPTVIAVVVSETIISGLCLGSRCYIRASKTGIGSDDAVLVSSWCFMVVFAIFYTVSSQYGFGQLVADLEASDIKMATLLGMCGQSSVAIAMGLSKTGVALFLARIANVKWQKRVLWGWIIAAMFLSVFLAVAVFAQCYPTQALWDANFKIQACPINLTHLAFVLCSYTAAMDFFLALCPYYVLKDLNMNRKEKWTIIVSLSLGVIAGAFGIARTAGLGVLASTSEYLYATADSVMFTSTELFLTLFCVSLPVFRPLFKRLASTHSSGRTYFSDPTARSRAGNFSQVKGANRLRSKNDEVYPMENVGGRVTRAETSEDEGFRSSWRDNGSDKSILADEAGIVRKQEYTVTYE